MSGANAALTARWIVGVDLKAGVQERPPGPARHEHFAHFPIGFDVGPPEAIDRLFRIADDEQLAGYRA